MQRRLAPSYYDILGVPPSAEPAEIEQAFRSRVREVRDLPGGGDRTHQLNLAYRALKDPDKRAHYDASLAGTPSPRTDKPPSPPAFFATSPSAFAPRESPAGEMHVEPDPPFVPETEPLPPSVTEPPGPNVIEPVAPSATEPPPPSPAEAETGADTPEYERDPAPLYLSEEYAPYELASGRYARAPEEEQRSEHVKPKRRGRTLALLGTAALAILGAVFFITPGERGEPPVRMASSDAPVRRPPPTAPAALPPAEVQAQEPPQEAAPPAAREEAASVATQPAPAEKQSDRGDQLDRAVSEALNASDAQDEEDKPTPTEERSQDRDDAPEAGEPERPVRSAPAPAPPPRRAVRPAPAPRISRAAPARHISGGLVNADNPRGQFVGSVAVRFTVLPNGRTTACRVTRSSGNGALDAKTCNLLQQRLRFAPARDEFGRPIAVEVGSSYTWGRIRRRS